MKQTVEVDLAHALQQRMPGFVRRQVQQDMATLVGEAIETKQNALIEAGTGTGKTYAYLLPTLSSGKKAVISTGTKTLQDQLYYQDIPLVNEAYGRTVALLKGRANYLCPHRLKANIETTSRGSNETIQQQLAYVYRWSENTRSGDLTEILDSGAANRVQSLVTSTADNCLGHDCPEFDVCPLYRARQNARDADIVVVNHHLFFADLALKEEAVGELLPDADVIILDEAHQVAEVARNFYGDHLGSGQMLDLSRDVAREQLLIGNDDPELIKTADQFTAAIQQLTDVILNSEMNFPALLDDLQGDIEKVDMSLSEMISRLDLAAPRSTGLSRCYSRACRLSDMFTLLTEETTPQDSAHWIERREKNFVLHLMPLDIAPHLAPLMQLPSKTWLFVSATLSTGDSFSHAKKTLGFQDGLEARYPSPFDFKSQTAGFVPAGLPEPGHPQHTQSLIAIMLPLIRSHTGRSMLLFTSNRALEMAARCMSGEHDLVYVVQGALPKVRLLEKFRELPRCILLATHSFWEGVDLKGADLKLLAIDKLPFTSPDDPVFQARLKQVDSGGGNSFRELSLPEAAITLKQGFGRLIRQETDQGLFVLGDIRMTTRSYGKTLKKSLPEMSWLADQAEAMKFMERIT
ncbi:MAG: ATP-dependent DNA helicase DinG [Candidatus Azotimanducaceae bacterium]